MLTLNDGPLALDPNPEITADVVSKYALPELTYKFLANGTATPAPVYVTLVGADNAPPEVPVTMLDVLDDTANGYVSPLSLETLPLIVNVAELVKCGIVLEYITALLANATLVLLNVGVPGVELS